MNTVLSYPSKKPVKPLRFTNRLDQSKKQKAWEEYYRVALDHYLLLCSSLVQRDILGGYIKYKLNTKYGILEVIKFTESSCIFACFDKLENNNPYYRGVGKYNFHGTDAAEILEEFKSWFEGVKQ